MKNINKIIRMASAGIALAVVFTIAFAAPASAHAYTYSYSTPSYTVSNSGYNYGYNYSRPVSYPVYYPIYQQPVATPVYYYPSLAVSCYVNPTSVSTGQSVTWEAYVSGGNGIYSYDWYGTNDSYGTNGSYTSGSTAYSTYYTPGSYTASVTVYSNGQNVTQSCGYVSVIGSYSYNYAPTYAYNYPTYYNTTPTYTTIASNNQNVGGNLVAACFADRTTASIGTPVTWSVEVTGGTGQYAYQWSGSDGLAGTGASAVQAYSSSGLKDADVLITSGGQSISQACGDSVDVRSYVAAAVRNYQGPAVNSAPVQNAAPSNPSAANPNSLSAAALLGLGAIPWGWIAILIIIVLGVAVFYLLFNRHKV